MMLVIRTQFQENYAAHQGFTGEYRWKMKGGAYNLGHKSFILRNQFSLAKARY